MSDDQNRFFACLPFTLAQECPFPSDWSNPRNFSNDAHDPGGATMCGIIQREYDTYRKSKGEPVQSVKLLTEAEGYDIYHTSYWLPDCPSLPMGLDLSYFDASVNEGSHEANKILQVSLGIAADGSWGSLTAAAVAAISNPTAIVRAFTARRQAVYRMMSGYRYFGTDWERRASEIGAQSLKMVGAPAPVAAAPIPVTMAASPALVPAASAASAAAASPGRGPAGFLQEFETLWRKHFPD